MAELDIPGSEILSREILTGVTIQDALIWFVAIIVVVSAYNYFRRVTMMSQREKGKKVAMSCGSCGWKGRATVSNSQCPTCGKGLQLR